MYKWMTINNRAHFIRHLISLETRYNHKWIFSSCVRHEQCHLVDKTLNISQQRKTERNLCGIFFLLTTLVWRVCLFLPAYGNSMAIHIAKEVTLSIILFVEFGLAWLCRPKHDFQWIIHIYSLHTEFNKSIFTANDSANANKYILYVFYFEQSDMSIYQFEILFCKRPNKW